MQPAPSFNEELQDLINRHSLENGSDTPDFLLAEYLARCLDNYNMTIAARDKWYDFNPWKRLQTGDVTTAPTHQEDSKS